jgi:universal stress protein F
MYRSILVPIDISETDLTRHVVPQVQAHAKTAKVHFLAVIPTVPFYASLGLAYSTEFPDRSGLQAKASEKLERLLSSSIFLQAGVKLMSFTDRRRIRSSNWRNQ